MGTTLCCFTLHASYAPFVQHLLHLIVSMTIHSHSGSLKCTDDAAATAAENFLSGFIKSPALT